MDQVEIERIGLQPKTGADLPTNKSRFIVTNLPTHLEAEISCSQFGSKYRLTRVRDVRVYEQNEGSRTAEDSLQELKKLLNWAPV